MNIAREQELTINGIRSAHCAHTLTTATSTFRGINNGDVTSGLAVLHASHPLDGGNHTEAINEADFQFITVRERAR